MSEATKMICRKQAADVLEVDPTTLWRWEKRGYGPTPHRLPNGRVEYVREDVLTWKARFRVELSQ